MGRSLRLLLAALTAGALTASFCSAGIPDPSLSSAGNVLVNPDGSLQYTVSVVGQSGPIDSAIVQLVFSTETDGLVCWCTGQTHPTIEALSGPTGDADFFISAGGCVDSGLVASPPAVEVFANGFKIAEVGVVSPDAVDDAGLLPLQGWSPGGTCQVVLSDAVFHTGPIVSAAYSFCTDFNSDGAVNVSDAVIATAPIILATACTQAP